jgi:hypothetical protein
MIGASDERHGSSVLPHDRIKPQARPIGSTWSRSNPGMPGEFAGWPFAIHFDLNRLRVAVAIDQDQDGVTA